MSDMEGDSTVQNFMKCRTYMTDCSRVVSVSLTKFCFDGEISRMLLWT